MHDENVLKMVLPEGKLSNEQLQSLVIDQIAYKDQWVSVHSSVGLDCGEIAIEEGKVVVSSDPITAAKESVGRLAVDISCNDIASAGARPRWLTLVMLMPYGTTGADLHHVMNQAACRASELKVEIIGGHTEITKAVTQPVLITTAIGHKTLSCQSSSLNNVQNEDILKTLESEPLLLVMTKVAGLEGTAIIAEEKADDLRGHLTEDELKEALSLYNETSVINEGVLAAECGAIVSHDVTEGGVLGAAWELCFGVGCGCEIMEGQIPILNVTKKISKVFDINPLKLISSGSLLSIISAKDFRRYAEALQRINVQLTVIGQIVKSNMDVIKMDGQRVPLEMPTADHLYKAIMR